MEARFALASTGDQQAIGELIREFDLGHVWTPQWTEKNRIQLDVTDPIVPEQLRKLIRALEAHEPALAAKVRMRLMTILANAKAGNTIPQRSLDLESIVRLAREGQDGDAMLRWARLDPKAALPVFRQQYADAKREIRFRHLAARAAAELNDPQAFAWLKEAVLGNVGLGGGPGKSLLESGPEGVKQYFNLVREYQKDHPGKPLPYALSFAPESAQWPAFWEHVPQLLDVEDKYLNAKVRQAIGQSKLTAPAILYLRERLEKDRYRDEFLADCVVESIVSNPPDSAGARQAVELWIEELTRSTNITAWKLAANVQLQQRIGDRQSSAAAARSNMRHDPELAAQILVEYGEPSDAVAVWKAFHPDRQEPHQDWYDHPADAWAGILKLTATP